MSLIDRLLTYIPERHRSAVLQFAGYAMVSAVALVVDTSVFWFLLSPLQMAAKAAVCGYICGVLTHYSLSSRIVFASRLRARGVKAEAPVIAKFFAAGALGLIVTATTVGILADGLGMPPLLAKFFAAGLSFGTVFTAMRVFVFNAPAVKPVGASSMETACSSPITP